MFTKVIFTILIVIAAWQGFKLFARLQDQRDKRNAMDRKDAQSPPPGVEDMVKCSVCEAYVARGSRSCGQDRCPFRG